MSEPGSEREAKKPPRARRWALVTAGALLAVLLVVAIAIALLWAALHSERGSAWLATWLPRVTIVEPKGSLVGDFSARRIDIELPGGAGALRIDAPRWRGLALVRGADGRWLRITIDELHAERVSVQESATKSPSPAEPASPPATLRLPVEVEVKALAVDELRVASADAAPLRDLKARLHLGAEGGARHRLDNVVAHRDRIDGQGQAQIGADPPFSVAGTFALASAVPAASAAAAGPSASAAAAGTRSSVGAAALPAWQANVEASGSLEALRLEAQVRSMPAPARAAQSLDADVVVRPYASWPFGALQVRAQALDLSAFASAWPATAISGRAVATTSSTGEPAQIDIDLDNARAGRVNEGLLPVRKLEGALRAAVTDPNVFDVTAFRASLGSERQPGGTLSGRGRWAKERWTLDATLEKVMPAALDSRAAAARLDGTVALVGTGFAAAGPSAERRIEATAKLQGAWLGNATRGAALPAVELVFEGAASERGGALAVEVRRGELASGSARAKIEGRADRAAVADASWALRAALALTDFDPFVGWRALEGARARAPSRLNGKADLDLVLPARFASADPLDRFTEVRGRAEIVFGESVLVGVPLQGTAAFRHAGSRAERSFDLVVAGNRLRGEGRLGSARRGEARAARDSDDAWQLGIDAPQLARLMPLWQLARPAAAPAPRIGGSVVASAKVAGRWPDVTSEGELAATDLTAGTLAVARASGRWRLGTAPGAPLEARFELARASLGETSIERLAADLKGTAKAHRLDLRVESKALPPEWADALQSAAATRAPEVAANVATSAAPAGMARSVAVVIAEGGLVDSRDTSAAGWRGVIDTIDIGSIAVPGRSWLRARDVRLAARWQGSASVDVEPGRAEVLGAAVRWRRLAWRAGEGGSVGHTDVDAEVDALPVAPILARLQPDFGWSGDLRVGARIAVRSAPTVMADIVVERTGGDLAVSDELGTEPLLLTDLRFGITARDGVWNFTQALAGKNLGVASGAVVARTSSSAPWPGLATPIEGVLELQVANLGVWGNWVPPGWRLGGALHASAVIGGRFGAPEYTGQVVGSALSVRNFVQGVAVSDGQLQVALRGSEARIERFTARAGPGTVSLEGDASLGEAPRARLRVTADRFQLLGRVDRKIIASGAAELRLDRATLALDGRFTVDEGLVDFTRADAPALGDDVVVVRRTSQAPNLAGGGGSDPHPGPLPQAGEGEGVSLPRPGGERAGVRGESASPALRVPAAASPAVPVPAPPTSRKVDLDLRVGLGERLRVRGRGLDARLRGELHVTSPNGRLAVNGTVSAVGGTYAAYGQKLAIDRGQLFFTGAVENPRLDIEATRPNLDIRVGVAVTGTALIPRVRLFSEPDLPEIEKLSWLVLGRGSEGVGRSDTALLQRAALALLSGEGPGVTDRLTQAIGLDDISVRQSEGEVRETIVSVGKQISKRWYVGYERGLNATTGSWQLVYRLARRLTVRAQAGGDNSIDLRWTLRWR